MFKLRQTWATLYPNAKLYSIDVKIQNGLDPAWPITATPPEPDQTSIHVNPKFLIQVGAFYKLKKRHNILIYEWDFFFALKN